MQSVLHTAILPWLSAFALAAGPALGALVMLRVGERAGAG
jgi:hypothetical protein